MHGVLNRFLNVRGRLVTLKQSDKGELFLFALLSGWGRNGNESSCPTVNIQQHKINYQTIGEGLQRAGSCKIDWAHGPSLYEPSLHIINNPNKIPNRTTKP